MYSTVVATNKDCVKETHVFPGWIGDLKKGYEPDTIAVPVVWLRELINMTDEEIKHNSIKKRFVEHVEVIRKLI